MFSTDRQTPEAERQALDKARLELEIARLRLEIKGDHRRWKAEFMLKAIALTGTIAGSTIAWIVQQVTRCGG
tara:strand:+ start:1119 stop:1334 length:216 start_codon:yes stop_codon:yes gene_type:complete